MGYGAAVDLGTAYTAAAVAEDGQARMLTLGSRSFQIPSVVALDGDDGAFVVGEAAERRAVLAPDRAAREFKRRFGDPVPLVLAGTPYTAQALMAEVLRSAVARLSEREGGPPDSLVLTHPANWGPNQRQQLLEVAELAGVGPVTLLSEPQAAAIHYASLTRVEPGALVAVYDLGGGTFDAAVLRKTDDGFELLGEPKGIDRLGGVDFDQAVVEQVLAALGDRWTSLDVDDPEVRAGIARLRRDAVDAKEALSSDTSATVPVQLGALRDEVQITRAELEQLIRPSLEATVATLREALDGAGVEAADLQAVLLVGGSSRIPLVAELVGEELGVPVAVDVDPKAAVALGAAGTAVAALPRRGPDAGGGAAPPPGPAAGRRRTLALVAAGGAAVVVAAVAVVALTAGGGDAGGAIEVPTSDPLPESTLVHTRIDADKWEIWALDAGDRSTRQLTRTITGGTKLPVLAPDRRSFLYLREATAGAELVRELWASSADGAEVRRLRSDVAVDARPTWSPDGRRIAYVAQPGDQEDLQILDLETGDVEVLTSGPDREGDPAWSPDGRTLAYWRADPTGTDLWLHDLESGERRPLTEGPDEDADPAWSPDGRRLAFSRRTGDGPWSIWSLVVDGGTPTRLTTAPAGADDQDPTWSPDGGRVAFESRGRLPVDTHLDIWAVPAGGGPPEQLTDHDDLDAHPAWR
jgi:actin-like ATPase involved in cell morphogenesis